MSRTVVYLRFPRPRDGFVDPDIVNWNAAKERELRSMLRHTSTDLEWEKLARHFDVSPTYILQQAAWLYEKELDIVKRRMSKFATGTNHSSKETTVQPLSSSVDLPESSITHQLTSNNSHPQFEEEEQSDSDAVEFTSRRLLTASRIDSTDSESSFSDSSLDVFLLPGTSAPEHHGVSTSSDDDQVSQSALEAALIDRLEESNEI